MKTSTAIPSGLRLSAEDLRYIRPSQLEILTGIDDSNFIAWSKHRELSERSLRRIARSLQIAESVVLEAFEQRRKDYKNQSSARAKASQLIKLFHQLNPEESA